MATINTRQTFHHSLDTEAKRTLRQKIDEILTPELRNECPGLAILVLSLDEYDLMQEALKEKANRKQKANINNKLRPTN